VRTHSADKLGGTQKESQTSRQHGHQAARPGRHETHVDRSEDDLGDKRVLDPDRLEDGSSVVEEVLRAHVHPYTCQHTIEDLAPHPQTTSALTFAPVNCWNAIMTIMTMVL
jgi:hypothetical protein